MAKTVSTPDEAPVTLRDRIVRLEGSASQKEESLKHIVAELFQYQGIPEEEEGVCVLVMPSCAVGAVIGTKGAKISEIMAESGTEIDVGRDCITGMPDNPVVLRGRPEQIVRAAVLSNAVLQELADKGRVQPDDFCYTPGRTPAPRATSRGAFTSSPAARFLVSKTFAGFLIGKGGEKITRLRDRTGATLQFRGSIEEVTLSLDPDQRILDIRGTAEERDQAVRACFVEMDQASLPNTVLLLPLAVPEVPLQEAVSAAGACVAQMQDDSVASPESTERVMRLEGDLEARLAAVLALLAKADAYGPIPASKPSPSPTPSPSPGPTPPKTANAAGTRPEVVQTSSSLPDRSGEKRLEPESGNVYTFEEFRKAFSGEYSEKDIEDYWRDACKAIPEKPASETEGPQVNNLKPVQTETAPPADTGILSKPSADMRGNLSKQTDPVKSNPAVGAPPVMPPRAGESIWLGGLLADSPPSKLQLLLPCKVVRGPLVAYGHLAEIATGCNVQIDVCGEVSPGRLELVLSGTSAAIAMATLMLQIRICLAQGPGGEV
ncbi:unnamed protein product [Effrenium voratum]|nr:unnamed protein product [Effrenium voratum]